MTPAFTLVAALIGTPIDVDTALTELSELPLIADNSAEIESMTGDTRVTVTDDSHITVIWVEDPSDDVLLATTGPTAPPALDQPLYGPRDPRRYNTQVHVNVGAAVDVVALVIDCLEVFAPPPPPSSSSSSSHVQHRASSSSSRAAHDRADHGDRRPVSKPRQRS